MKKIFSIYRYNPDVDNKPYMKDYTLEIEDGSDMMVLDALILLKEQDPTLSFRRSCREGVCGSDGVNMNGKNGLACITPLSHLKGSKIILRPLPGLPVVRDLIIDMTQFYTQYEKVKPYLINDGKNPPAREHLQSVEERDKLDGLYECILCACCSTSCPSYWWNGNEYLGPAVLMQAYRWIEDSRDIKQVERMEYVDDAMKLYRCKSIMNCSNTCPKGLNPGKAIGELKKKIDIELHHPLS